MDGGHHLENRPTSTLAQKIRARTLLSKYWTSLRTSPDEPNNCDLGNAVSETEKNFSTEPSTTHERHHKLPDSLKNAILPQTTATRQQTRRVRVKTQNKLLKSHLAIMTAWHWAFGIRRRTACLGMPKDGGAVMRVWGVAVGGGL